MSSSEMRKIMAALGGKKTLNERWDDPQDSGFDANDSTDVADTMDFYADKSEELAGDLIDIFDKMSRHIEDARRNGIDVSLISAMETQKKQALVTALNVVKNLMN